MTIHFNRYMKANQPKIPEVTDDDDSTKDGHTFKDLKHATKIITNPPKLQKMLSAYVDDKNTK